MEQLRHVLFFDLETVPVAAHFSELSESMQAHWAKKAGGIRGGKGENADPAQLFSDRAGIYSEFAKIICISFGSFHQRGEQWRFRVKSLAGSDEKLLLNEFCAVLSRFAHFYQTELHLCGHNIREFDVPFLCRRMVMHDMSLPHCLQVQGKKPWDIRHIEYTMELWRFGDSKNFTSLALLADLLGIPSPKDDIDGSMVAGVYYQDGDLDRIARYCAKDVVTAARVYLRLKGIEDVTAEPEFV